MVLPSGRPNGVGHTNEVTHMSTGCRARLLPEVFKTCPVLLTYLLPRWVTVREYTVLVCNQPLKPTQSPILSGMGNEYRPRGSGSAVCLGR